MSRRHTTRVQLQGDLYDVSTDAATWDATAGFLCTLARGACMRGALPEPLVVDICLKLEGVGPSELTKRECRTLANALAVWLERNTEGRGELSDAHLSEISGFLAENYGAIIRVA